MKIHTPNNRILLSIIFLIAFNFGQGKDYDISGKVVDSSGEKVGKVTVLLLDKNELEVQSTKAKGSGKFKFKKVLSGQYIVSVDGGELGKGSAPVTVEEDDVKNLEIVVSIQTPPTVVEEAPAVEQEVAAVEAPINDGPLVPEAAVEDKSGDVGSTYIMNVF